MLQKYQEVQDRGRSNVGMENKSPAETFNAGLFYWIFLVMDYRISLSVRISCEPLLRKDKTIFFRPADNLGADKKKAKTF